MNGITRDLREEIIAKAVLLSMLISRATVLLFLTAHVMAAWQLQVSDSRCHGRDCRTRGSNNRFADVLVSGYKYGSKSHG
jgi:hypothetical protein